MFQLTKTRPVKDAPNKGQILPEEKKLLPLFVVGTFGLNLLALFLLTYQGAVLTSIANQKPPVLYQAVDGQAFPVGTMGYYERSPQVIRKFVGDVTSLLVEANGYLPPESIEDSKSPKRDPGVSVEGISNRISTSAWQAGFGLSETFRAEFLKKLAQITPQEIFNYTSGDANTQRTLVIRYLTDPIKLAEGKWKVRMIADMLTFSAGSRLGSRIPFNKEVFVQAVEPPRELPGQSQLERKIFMTRQSGLEITGIRDLNKEDM